ncbi:MAG: HAMP domain-containing histidine kinase [Lachnospiraceae bacterium]|nr:HAMP domain-containing histidine kinase [Lachnospiraceae bacterium]
MIRKLSRRLTLLFAGVTSLILTLLLCVAFLYQDTQLETQTDQSFQRYLTEIKHRLELDSSLSDEWLARVEVEGRLIIYIEDNGRPLFFRGAWKPETPRESLVARAKGLALLERVDTSQAPFSYSSRETGIFSVEGDQRDTYLGSVVVVSTDKGFRSLVLLWDTSARRETAKWQRLLFLGLETFGVLALYLVSRKVVGRAVRPVEEYHKKQTEFVAAASHELRSPLAVIQTCASAMEAVPEECIHMTEIIKRECTRTGKLVKSLLLLASLDAGTEASIQDGKAVEADQILLELLEAYEPLCQSRDMDLYLKLPPDLLPTVQGDARWIYQILAIFLDNAIAYGCGRENRIIELLAEEKGSRVVLSVRDHGSGVPEEWKQKIFERFSRMDASRHDKEHFGLGLGIAAELSERMGAELSVKDTPGGGSTFQIILRK